MELHLKITGVVLVLLAALHIVFPRYFNWKAELGNISVINRQMMYVHTFFIALMVLLMGILCLSSSVELVSTALGKKLSLGIGFFWTARLFIQFFGYSAVLWKGRNFETSMHVLFSLLWAYLSFVFLGVYLG